MTRRLTHLLTALSLAMLLAGVAPISRVFACSCMQLQPGEALAMSTVAFTGVVAEIDEPTGVDPTVSSLDPLIYTFVVEESLKGEPGETVLLESARSSASCGMEFAIGERWTVYASVAESRRLTSGLCSGNEMLADGVPVPQIPTDDAGIPMQLLLVGGVVVAVAAASAFIFLRRPRTAAEEA